MNVTLSTVLDAPPGRVWQEVRTPRLLDHVAAPLIVFAPVQPAVLPSEWHEGRYLVRMKLLGLLPLGSQWIGIEHQPQTAGRYTIRDNGQGTFAGRWDHWITIEGLPDGRTRYTDSVTVRSGPLTPLVWLFARVFYAHRQRRWRRLVRRGFRYD